MNDHLNHDAACVTCALVDYCNLLKPDERKASRKQDDRPASLVANLDPEVTEQRQFSMVRINHPTKMTQPHTHAICRQGP